MVRLPSFKHRSSSSPDMLNETEVSHYVRKSSPARDHVPLNSFILQHVEEAILACFLSQWTNLPPLWVSAVFPFIQLIPALAQCSPASGVQSQEI